MIKHSREGIEERKLEGDRKEEFEGGLGREAELSGIQRKDVDLVRSGILNRVNKIKEGQTTDTEFSPDADLVLSMKVHELLTKGIVPVVITNENPFGEPLWPVDSIDLEAAKLRHELEESGTQQTVAELMKNRASGKIKLVRTNPKFGFSFGKFVQPTPIETIQKAWEDDNLGFQAPNRNTSHISVARSKNGKWSEMHTIPNATIAAPSLQQVLHYGAALFEGVDNRRSPDGKVRGFRWKDNWARMNKGAKRLMLPEIPYELFERGMIDGIRANAKYIPPSGHGRLYGRPNYYDSGEKMQVGPSFESTLAITMVPIGSGKAYFNKPGKKHFGIAVNRSRALPHRGHIKMAGLYAMTEAEIDAAHKAGFDGLIYCDANGKFMSETYASSVVGRKGDTLVFLDLDDEDVLASITADTTFRVAGDRGFKGVKEKTPLSKIGEFDELMAVGTGAAFTPIHLASFVYFDEDGKVQKINGNTLSFEGGGTNGDGLGTAGQIFSQYIEAIKNGQVEKYQDWITEIDGI